MYTCQVCSGDVDNPLGDICSCCKWEQDPSLEDGWSAANHAGIEEYRLWWSVVQRRADDLVEAALNLIGEGSATATKAWALEVVKNLIPPPGV